jgi:hypothetical protein
MSTPDRAHFYAGFALGVLCALALAVFVAYGYFGG